MYTIEHIRELYIYNDWVNRQLIVALKSRPSEKALKILGHVLITEREYYERLFGKDSTSFDFWSEPSLEECSKIAHENHTNFERLLKGFDDEGLGQPAAYKTSEGVAHQNTYREMLTHVLFHSATHRGQINTALREDGYEPVSVDYILYLRAIKS